MNISWYTNNSFVCRRTRQYRYGFNGKENDNEVKGVTGSQQDYGMRIYDPRLGKFLSVDPLTKSYPELTPYQFASNTPIYAIDLDGLEACGNPIAHARGLTGHNCQLSLHKDATVKQQVVEIGGFALGMGAVLVAPAVLPAAGAVFYNTAAYAATPSGQLGLWQIASFTINMLYDGPDDPLPSPSAGGEAAQFFKGLLKPIFESKGLMKSAAVDEIKFVYGAVKDKIAIIGQGMDRVTTIASGIKNANVFKASDEALKEWSTLTKDGARISDEAVKETMLYKENQTWISEMKKEGVTIMDIGADKSGTTSSFYEMEKQTVYDGKQ